MWEKWQQRYSDHLPLHFNPFSGKGVKHDPRQQNNDFERSGVSSRLKFYTGSLEVASDRISHKIFFSIYHKSWTKWGLDTLFFCFSEVNECSFQYHSVWIHRGWFTWWYWWNKMKFCKLFVSLSAIMAFSNSCKCCHGYNYQF